MYELYTESVVILSITKVFHNVSKTLQVYSLWKCIADYGDRTVVLSKPRGKFAKSSEKWARMTVSSAVTACDLNTRQIVIGWFAKSTNTGLHI